MDSLLSRFAEDSYWLARYIERAHDLARILDVTKSFGDAHDAGANWGSVLDLFDDRAAFKKKYKSISARDVIRFYVLDKTNPNSIISCVGAAHNNARTLRHLISVDMWVLINIFYNDLLALRTRDVTENRLSAVCQMIKDRSELTQGCATNTLYRDQVWQFHQLGLLVESCDQITRLVDIKTKPMLAGKRSVAEGIELSQWNLLLRAAAAYHGYLRAYPHDISGKEVTRFILFDPKFTGSLTLCLAEIKTAVDELQHAVGEKKTNPVKRQIRRLEKLNKAFPADGGADELHIFLDNVQLELVNLHKVLSAQFFPELELNAA
ncbi:MAG: alpha-E domain-containing protein [Burkholderiaceae bacterium]